MPRCETTDLRAYKRETELVDFSHDSIQGLLKDRFSTITDTTESIRAIYEFVRDEIRHSWDIRSRRITMKASEVLEFREGICYAKTILMAALLRARGIPAGFCYQKLTLGDTPESGYAIHALNGVYIEPRDTWIRLDARGNKASVKAEFSLDKEILAFNVRPECREVDYPIVYVQPNEKTIAALKKYADCMELYQNGLPDEL